MDDFFITLDSVLTRAPTSLPSVDALTRALWQSDHRTLEFIERVSDMTHPEDAGKVAQRCDPGRWVQAMETAWERNEPAGVRAHARERAHRVLAILRGESW